MSIYSSGSTSLTPLSSKTYSPISHEEELIDTSDAPAVRSVRKEAKEERMSVKKEDKNADRWLSKATRARMASKAARALEAIIRTEEADVLSDYEFERKLHKSVKKASKIKSPKSSKKSKKSRVSMVFYYFFRIPTYLVGSTTRSCCTCHNNGSKF